MRKDYIKMLADNLWALIPISVPTGDDGKIMWVVVSFIDGDNCKGKVIGESWSESEPELAIEDALETTRDDCYAYKYNYKQIK